MSIKVADVAKKLLFVIYDSTDHITPKTGLSSFTAYYTIGGGAATVITTPTVAELDATNMAGVYSIAIDEAGMVASENELLVNITHAGADDVSLSTDVVTNTNADIITAIAALNDPTAVAIRTEIDSNSTQLSAIVADTNELQADFTNGGRLDLLIDEILTDTGTTLNNKIDTIDGIVDAILVDTATTIPASLTTIDNEIATIDGIVDNILVDTGTTLDGKLDTIDGIVDAILVDTGTTIPATLTTIDNEIATIDGIVDSILADTGELQTDWANGGRLDLLIDAILTDTGTTLDGKITTIDGIVDSILVDTGTTIPATIATIDNEIATIDGIVDTILVDTNELQTDWVNGGRLDLLVDTVVAATTGSTLADAVLDEVIESTLTLRQAVMLTVSVLQGKSDKTGATVKFRDYADTTDRVTATVDASGNRTAITRDVTP